MTSDIVCLLLLLLIVVVYAEILQQTCLPLSSNNQCNAWHTSQGAMVPLYLLQLGSHALQT